MSILNKIADLFGFGKPTPYPEFMHLHNRNHVPAGAPVVEVLDAVVEYLGLEVYIDGDLVRVRPKVKP